MGKIIKIQILHDLALNAAKNETFQKGVVDKAVDPKLITAAYHEQAGNEQYHEIMLRRFLFTQIEKLKTKYSDYLTGEGNLSNDATVDTTENEGVTEILLSVSDRFNNGYVKTLARLSQKYVEDRMIHLWWVPVSKEFAALYAQIADDDLTGILECFKKSAPVAPVYQFPTGIILQYPVIPERNGIPSVLYPGGSDGDVPVAPEILYGNPWCIGRGDHTEISYTLTGENDKKPIDDIVVRCDNGCCMACIGNDGHWYIEGKAAGYTIVTLFSRHNDNVYAQFAVRVV